MDITKNYYKILEINPTANQDEIKSAHRQLARRYHPDTSTEPDAVERFQEIQVAYEILSDERQRRAYDQSRAEAGLSEEAVLAWDLSVSRQTLPVMPEDQMLYILIEISPAVTMEAKRLPLNLCLVIDRSTSMQNQRMEQVKAAAYQIIDDLKEEDAFSIVTFSDRAEVVVPSQWGGDRRLAKSRLHAIRPSGGTEIYQGLALGVQEVSRQRRLRAVNHLILLTDGQTYGDEENCLMLAKEARGKGIGISAMGIGEDWNDQLLDDIAAQSGGISAYIDSASQVRSLLRQRVQRLEAVYAQDLQLTHRLIQDIHLENAFKLSPYIAPLERIEPDVLSLGALELERPLNILLEMIVESQKPGRRRIMQLEITGDVQAVGRQGERLRRDLWFNFTENPITDAEVPANLVNALAKLAIYRMQQGAMDALDAGDANTASQKLEVMATRLFDLGELDLAHAAQLEAGRLAQGGQLTQAGRKKLKYGTRSLSLGQTGGLL